MSGGPVGITFGKDRQIYTVLFLAGAVERLDLAGNVTGEWALPGAGGPLQIAQGTDLDMYVTDTFGSGFYRLTPYDAGRS